MFPAGELSWLCRLVVETLNPYTEPDAFSSICKQKEKELLLASSQVVRKIQLRIREFDSHIESTATKPVPNDDGLFCSDHHFSAHQCLSAIVTKMMTLLTIKDEFVRHVAVNALVLTSQFVLKSGNKWDEFIKLWCRLLEMSITKMLLPLSTHYIGSEKCGFDSSDVNLLMQFGLKNCDWSTVAGITQVLRVICKGLKEEDYDDELLKVYYDSVNSCFSKVPWDLLDEYWSRDIDGSNESSDSGALEPRIKFLGAFLQLLCSLIDRNDFWETDCESAYANKHPLIGKICNLIPRLVTWCLVKQEDRADTCIVHYLKHKLLTLMIRLGSLISPDGSVCLSWLDLLHNFFQELLKKPLNQFQSEQDDCLEGSPFLLSLSNGESCWMHSSHLQRQAVFLLLHCSFSFIRQRGVNAGHRNCPTSCSCFKENQDSELDSFYKRKGSLELYKWVQAHLPTEISINHEMYLAICMNFMSSFLQLYLREDDLLFEVMLQLLSISSCLQQQFDIKEALYQDVKKEFLFDLLDIFNSVHLFHLFLSEIHYDHQVLLDYLISKDTGISCAKYLLSRCLCLICDSWDLFVESPLVGEYYSKSSCKRRKLSGDGIDFVADEIPTSVDNYRSTTLHSKNYEKDIEYCFKHYDIKPFKNAAECLLSLYNSIENLHQKDLFPYNPEVLLKRLRKFQEFCWQEQRFHGERTEK
ncbi:uncharacterized protein LOC107495502 isoform X1 [Arachis duranensis]|uniref:Uncharacterized protein LOC107495502 isoform X1 n=2 Tax=Arachis duranensis TaxID=130453 RepID=A0A6P5MBM9_ARADU|nr:uncharacterized protein LOC107495502 isoform X1 [Arachis duranensis]XP_015931848.1 uncharacterized protein LOC107495502 isoform X1 [Arachis duranensis]XP_015972472.1 uncharacterized protein LOC107495502 isoform X1 [Arachis duranensis]XP_015973145.1 uncharacterized protein LOC107495502 isoform X1 [Arachis duranensis]XP_020981815.1 uncharacterized protein LOC107495502 isoform X1 [Arachis duranensis]XP_020981840.1 uncharacterized protein LOC107495502 isoform X1 [Arachis duranensis]XP_02098186